MQSAPRALQRRWQLQQRHSFSLVKPCLIACHFKAAGTHACTTRRNLTGTAAAADMRQDSTPLLDAVLARGNKLHEAPFHVPGHKRGRVLDKGMQQLLDDPGAGGHGTGGVNPLRFDLTELAGLDYLSSPDSVIKQAQELAASAFGADHSWFLVNGCSAGIHAAVMAAVRPGQALLLARNCHLSAFSACVLADCIPVWLQPEEDGVHGIAHCITPEQLRAGFEAARQQGLTLGAVLVVSPTYYGAVARIAELAAVCHEADVPLLVDEAHGGHLSIMAQDVNAAAAAPAAAASTPQASAAAADPDLSAATSSSHGRTQPTHSGSDCKAADSGDGSNHSRRSSSSGCGGCSTVPQGALACGADVVMHSSHKVLTAMTQSAMLHLNGSRVDASRISRALQLLQTSSPSYMLMSSLDAARRHAASPGVWSTPLALAAAARDGLARVPGLTLLQQGSCGSEASVSGFDPLRLVLNVQGLGVSGFDAAAWLEQHHGIVPELATSKLVVFVVGPGSIMADASALVEACKQLNAQQQAAVSPPGSLSVSSITQQASTTGSTLQVSPEVGHDSSTTFSALDPADALPSLEQQGVQQPLPMAPTRPQQQLGQAALARPTLTPRQAFFAGTEAVPLAAAVGRVSAELLCPYPPGVPAVFPGERLTSATVKLLRETLAGAGVVTGGQDSQLMSVLVVVHEETWMAAPSEAVM